ncbi:L-lactate transporter-like isoform X2 [Haliotis rufescens]|uniref:L-lactate transporter-like isoform X2 n=1 Tax=Haliotis rufescens TaxID=6454 RepID=UPI00201F2FA4|nr:L-lactate transporter-like isoform X2 [Haliotis rufescens]
MACERDGNCSGRVSRPLDPQHHLRFREYEPVRYLLPARGGGELQRGLHTDHMDINCSGHVYGGGNAYLGFAGTTDSSQILCAHWLVDFQCFPKRKGLVTGLIIAGIGGGTFVFNEVITHFINPYNLLPETSHQGDLYFSQAVLLDKVPYCFLLLGGVDAGIQLLAVLLIGKHEPAAPAPENSALTEETQMDHVLDCPVNKENYEDGEGLGAKSKSGVEEKTDYAPWEVLRTKIFYLMWAIYVCVVLGIFFITNFYKTFSQTFIKDDHFLSLAGSVSSVLNALGRPFWGAVGDKLGYRESLVVVCAILGSAAATFTLCEYGGKVMLIIWMCLIYGTFSGFFCIMPSLNVSIFGHKYYSSNYGLLMSAMIVVQIAGGLLTSQLKDTIGWKGILYIGAGGVFFSLILSVGMMIHHRRQRKKHQM